MDIRIKTTDYEITSEVKAYLEEKIAAIEKLLAHDAHAARVEAVRWVRRNRGMCGAQNLS